MMELNFLVKRQFACPDCNVPVILNEAGYTDTGHIYLIGTCPKCKCRIALDLINVVKHIMKAAQPQLN